MSKTRSPYEILGVTSADDITTIRQAWRAKVKRLHPDRALNKVEATQDLAEVNAAFDQLRGHAPPASAKAGKAAEKARWAARWRERARRAAARRAEDRRRLEEKAEAVRRQREALAREEARAKKAKARLESDMSSINAKAVQGYAEARRVVSTLQK